MTAKKKETKPVGTTTGGIKKESSTILNIVVIALGALFLIQAILSIISLIDPSIIPTTFGDIIEGAGGEAATALLGQSSTITLILGVWLFIAGIGLFQEQEWAWGICITVLSIILVNTISGLVGWITSGTFNAASILTWISLIGMVIAAIAFVYLLATKSRYY